MKTTDFLTPAERLILRLNKELGLGLKKPKFVRTRAGHWQRSAGAWLWEVHHEDLSPGVGSQWRATDLMTCKTILAVREGSDIYIEPGTIEDERRIGRRRAIRAERKKR